MSQNHQPSSIETRSESQKRPPSASKDLAHGQIVIVTARWILVLAGLLLALWNPEAVGELRLQIMVILSLAIANFYLQAQMLMRRPVADKIVYAASAADLIVITILIIVGGGFESGLYIFYFPAILAFSVAFITPITWFYVLSTMAVYALICLFSSGVGVDQLQIILMRLIMIAAVAYCGNLYWSIENDRRRAAKTAQDELLTEIRRRQTAPVVQT